MLLYTPLFSIPFLYDDFDFLFSWTQIQNTHHLPELLLGNTPQYHEGVYRPLRSLLYVVSFGLFHHTLFWYHMQELMIYLLCIGFVYLFTQQLLGKRMVSFVTALFFGVMVSHTDNVANLTASFDTTGFLWALISLCSFLHFLKHNKQRYFALSIVTTGLAYFTYELTLILPLLFILIAYYKKHPIRWKLFLPASILALVSVATRVLFAIPAKGAVLVDLPAKLLLLAQGFLLYFLLPFMPLPSDTPTLADYQGTFLFSASPPHVHTSAQIISSGLIVGIVFLFLLLALTFVLLRKRTMSGFCLAWFFICLLPTIGIGLQSSENYGIQQLSHRYSFLASYGICLLLALWFSALTSHFRKASAFKKYLRIFGIICIICLFVLHLTTTIKTLADWQDPRPLLKQQIEKGSTGAKKENDWGVLFITYQEYDKALVSFQKAIKQDPKYSLAKENLTKLCTELKKKNNPLRERCN